MQRRREVVSAIGAVLILFSLAAWYIALRRPYIGAFFATVATSGCVALVLTRSDRSTSS